MNVTKEMNIQIRLLVEDSQQLIKLKDKNESHQNELKKKTQGKTEQEKWNELNLIVREREKKGKK